MGCPYLNLLNLVSFDELDRTDEESTHIICLTRHSTKMHHKTYEKQSFFYSGQFREFLTYNRGISHLFPTYFSFPDYSLTYFPNISHFSFVFLIISHFSTAFPVISHFSVASPDISHYASHFSVTFSVISHFLIGFSV